MKKCLVLLMVLILVGVRTKPAASIPFLEGFERETRGSLRIGTGYLWVNGNQEDYAGRYNLTPGFNYNYVIDLSGEFYSNTSSLYYSVNKTPGGYFSWNGLWTSPWFVAQYNEGVRLNFDEINLAFARTRLDGLKVEVFNNNITFFTGMESNIPMQKTFIIQDQMQNEFRLFDIPSAGDILTNSDLITLNGSILVRDKDYQLNYLNGKLTIMVPLEVGMVIQAKFQYIITNEEFSPSREKIQGIVFSQRWVDNVLSLFYFQRGFGKTKLEQLETGSKMTQVGGIAGEYYHGPFNYKGEWAVTEEDGNYYPAYDMNFHYQDETVKVGYQLRDINSNFQEIGVNSFIPGFTQQFDLEYQVDEDINLQLQVARYQIETNDSAFTVSSHSGTLDYLFTPVQSGLLIFTNRSRTLNEIEKNEKDLSLGYAYKTRAFTVNVGQSVSDSDLRFVKVITNLDRLRLHGDYYVESLWEGKSHKLVKEMTLIPFNSLDINSYLEYNKPFVGDNANLRWNLNGTWYGIQGLYLLGGYTYFDNQKYNLYNHRYLLNINYNKGSYNSDLNFLRTNMESPTVKSFTQEGSLTTGIALGSQYVITHNINHKNSEEFMKFLDMVYQKSYNHLQSVELKYLWNNYNNLSAKVEYTDNGSTILDSFSNDVRKSGIVGYEYRIDQDHWFTFGTGIEERRRDRLWTITNGVNYPFKWITLEQRIKADYSLVRNEFTHYEIRSKMIFPSILRITPILDYATDYENREGRLHRTGSFSTMFKYHLDKERYLYLEGRRDFKVDFIEDDKSYHGVGVFAGIEFIY